MESKIRLLGKAVTWQVSGLCSMMIIGFIFTGSVAAGGGIAVVGAVVGFVAYFLHELAWSKVSWGQRQDAGSIGVQPPSAG